MIIYKTTNLLNDKFYIGQDKNDNPNYLGSGKYLKRAIEKYGIDNFKKETLESVQTKDELNEREIFWIEKTNAMKLGYNIASGGQGGNLGPAVAERKSKSLKEFHNKNPNAKVGKNNSRYDDTKYEFYNIETEEVLISSKFELAQKLNSKSKSSPINSVIVGRIKRYKNWILLENKEKYTIEYFQDQRIKNNTNYISDYIEIINIKTGIVFKGEMSAARLSHPEIQTNGLQKLLNKKIKKHFNWSLLNREDEKDK